MPKLQTVDDLLSMNEEGAGYLDLKQPPTVASKEYLQTALKDAIDHAVRQFCSMWQEQLAKKFAELYGGHVKAVNGRWRVLEPMGYDSSFSVDFALQPKNYEISGGIQTFISLLQNDSVVKVWSDTSGKKSGDSLLREIANPLRNLLKQISNPVQSKTTL